MTGSCHCGAVTIVLTRPPDWVGACNCSICRKLGWLLAYYPEHDVTIEGGTETYIWGDRMLAFHRCPTCGCATHWRSIDPHRDPGKMGVNARLLDGFDPGNFEIRLLDNS